MSAGLVRVCPACGRCKQPLPPIDEPVEADPATFDAVVQQSKAPVLVDFWTSWCGPCKMAAPEASAVAREMAGRAVVLKVDTERYPELAARYGVQGIPSFLVIRDGRVVTQKAVVTSRHEMRRWLEAA